MKSKSIKLSLKFKEDTIQNNPSKHGKKALGLLLTKLKLAAILLGYR